MLLRHAVLALMLLGPALASPALAASMSTGWEDFPGTQDECLQAGAARLRQMGYRVTVNPQTVFGWRGEAGVSVRCINERRVAAIFVYSPESAEAARGALDELRGAYREWRPARRGSGGGGSKF